MGSTPYVKLRWVVKTTEALRDTMILVFFSKSDFVFVYLKSKLVTLSLRKSEFVLRNLEIGVCLCSQNLNSELMLLCCSGPSI